MAAPTSNSFAPPKSAVADVGTSDSEFEKATPGSRLGASLLDGLILTLPFVPAYFIAFSRMGLGGVGRSPGRGAFAAAMMQAGLWSGLGMLFAIVSLTITAVLVHRNGQTIGKKLVGIKVVRKDGSRATLTRIFFLRYLCNTLLTLVPIAGGLYALVDMLFIFGAPTRCCHDYLADTIVVRA
jgi:uncharacterized RDD family membrane protein YckC